MIIGTLQDYISARKRVPETLAQKCWRYWLKFFEIEHEPKGFQLFFTLWMGILTSSLILSGYLILHTLGGQ